MSVEIVLAIATTLVSVLAGVIAALWKLDRNRLVADIDTARLQLETIDKRWRDHAADQQAEITELHSKRLHLATNILNTTVTALNDSARAARVLDSALAGRRDSGEHGG